MKAKNIALALALATMMGACKDDPQPLYYEGFTLEAENDAIQADRGETVMLLGHVICENGVKSIGVSAGPWYDGTKPTSETIDITGSPKTYQLEYAITIPTDATVDLNEVEFIISDYAGNSITHTYHIVLRDDDEAPEMAIAAPVEGKVISPLDALKLEVTVRDNLALKSLLIKCLDLDFDKLYVPAADITTIKVNEDVDVTEANGEYAFSFIAEDLCGNVTEETRTVKVMVGSKPEIRRSDDYSGYASIGGETGFKVEISTNFEHKIASVTVKSPGFGINENLAPNEMSVSIERKFTMPSSANGKSNIPVEIKAVNDAGETTELTIYYTPLDGVYAIGTATMAKAKESKALKMQQSDTDKNVYTLVTWVEAQDAWMKFLSEPSWNGLLNLGLADDGIHLENTNNVIPLTEVGYHTITFDLAKFTYKVEKYTAPAHGRFSNLYVYGQDFEYRVDGKWKTVEPWNEMVPFNTYPGNPHRFYVDVLCHKSVIGFSAQTDKADGGIFFGISGDPGWKWVWWEFVEPLVEKNKEADTTKAKEDGREDNVMRIIIDTHLNMVSWLESGEYTYPEPTKK